MTTPIILGKVLRDVDAITKQMRFTGWNETQEGDRPQGTARDVEALCPPVTGPLFHHDYGYICENY